MWPLGVTLWTGGLPGVSETFSAGLKVIKIFLVCFSKYVNTNIFHGLFSSCHVKHTCALQISGLNMLWQNLYPFVSHQACVIRSYEVCLRSSESTLQAAVGCKCTTQWQQPIKSLTQIPPKMKRSLKSMTEAWCLYNAPDNKQGIIRCIISGGLMG